MSPRALPPRPHLDHLKREAKALRRTFRDGGDDARERVEAVLGPRQALKLTEAQRVIAREYGFRGWAALRIHVLAARGATAAVEAFLRAVSFGHLAGAKRVLEAEPAIARSSVHVAAVLGDVDRVRRLISEDPARVHARTGPFSGDPLLWLCHSPFHGESSDRDEGLAAAARALLDAGADPNTRDSRYGVPALYAVTGLHDVPRIARMLLDAGAEVDDGESVFHAAERFHVEALELLLERGVDLNRTGDWGNTPLYFLLRYWDVETEPSVKRGLLWLLEHGADPDVRCGRERETSLHVAARVGQSPGVIRLLLDHGADIGARRGDGRTVWNLAYRSGQDELLALLEEAGAEPEAPSPGDRLLAACGRGDAEAALRLTSPELVGSLDASELALVPAAAARGRWEALHAYLAAGFPVDVRDEQGATALHHASIHGHAAAVAELLARHADHGIRDREHDAAPLGWALFGADHVADPEGDYEGTVRELLRAGASVAAGEPGHPHAGVAEVLREHAVQRFERAADAVVAGDAATLRRLLRQDEELVRRRSERAHRAPLLHYVTANGVEDDRQLCPPNAVEIGRIILDAGAEVDATGEAYGGGCTALVLVASSQPPRRAGVQIPLIDLLLERGAALEGAEAGTSPLAAALANGCPEAARALVDRGASVSDVVTAAGVGRLDLVEPLAGEADGRDLERALIAAAGVPGATEVVEHLLDRGVDIAASDDGMTALHRAAGGGDLDTIDLLVRRGAPLEKENVYGGTVLAQAIWHAFNEDPADVGAYGAVIDALVAAGARTDAYPQMGEHLAEIRRRAGEDA